MRDDNDLFFTCSLIEYIGRVQTRKRGEIVEMLGDDTLRRIYRYADALHCEPIMKTADEYIKMREISPGSFDNVRMCRYRVPGYWTIGEVYKRLIEDVSEKDTVNTLKEVYGSWISDAISNHNTDFFYQPRDYIRECYLAGEVLL